MENLNEVNLGSLMDSHLAHEYFLRTFNGLCNHAFPIKKVSLKLKTVFNPWMTKGLQQSSKRKLYDKLLLKSKTNENEKKSLFEILKEESKQLY